MSHTDNGSEHELVTQVEFSDHMVHEGSPATEFRQTPDRTFFRKFFSDRLRFPDGVESEIWSFEDETSGRGLPAPPIRAREGDVVHVTLKPSKGAHTIHLHGIEPDPRNDGVGHTSFEVTGEYTYQVQANRGVPGDPNQGMAGTYFYHCHVNTTLHVQMGMFGPMIFDPPEGRGKAFVDDPVGYDKRAETLLVPYGLDPRWHELGHAAGLNGEDAGLNDYRPTSFYALGADLSKPWPDTPVKTVERILATTAPDKPGLLRINNVGYFPAFVRFHDGLQAEVISHDGRALRDTSVVPSPPVSLMTDLLGCGAAERYDVRLRPPAGARPGDTFSVSIEWRQWVTGAVAGRVTVPVVVIEPGDDPAVEPEPERAPESAAPAPAPGAAPAPAAPAGPSAGAPRRPAVRKPRRKPKPPRKPKPARKPRGARRRRTRRRR